ncbi:hypothetical protein [Nocardia transvalensis]|uniref:hypothetical protein n=1 Tax=Nocardia transvalensis TaxID=37333 RepID=UPI001E5CDEE3|nr:hypothetical protein [Nocardia transvalensis]
MATEKPPSPRFDLYYCTESAAARTLRATRIRVAATAEKIAAQLLELAREGHDDNGRIIWHWNGIAIAYGDPDPGGCHDIDYYDVEPTRGGDPANTAEPLLRVMLATRWPDTPFTLIPDRSARALRLAWQDGPPPTAVRSFAAQIPSNPFHPWTDGIACDRRLSDQAWAIVADEIDSTYHADDLRVPRTESRIDWPAATERHTDIHVAGTGDAQDPPHTLTCSIAELLRAHAYTRDFTPLSRQINPWGEQPAPPATLPGACHEHRNTR